VTIPADLPEALAPLRAHNWSATTIGRSGAAIWRIDMGAGALFLKSEPAHALSELPGEIARLEWLAQTGFLAPRVVDVVEAADRHWLVMTAVQGQDLAQSSASPAELCRIYAGGLRRLHALDASDCPFDHRIANRLAEGAANIAAGRVDESDFDDARAGQTAAQVFDWLDANRIAENDLVLTHGDASAPNILENAGRFSGVVDCGRLGVASRWQDLALACRSIIYNWGEEHVPAFLATYGAQWDAERYRYYCALDELF
jgi:aminoglycoside 3'-phosphotransferase-2